MRNKNNVILVNIVHQIDDKGNYPPLSTASLKAYADKFEHIKNNYDISLFTSSFDRFDPESLIEEVKEKKPSIIGLSCYTWNLKQYMEILPEIKQIVGDALVITGGPEAHPGLLNISSEMDVIAIGEGEMLFKEILERQLEGKTWQDTLGTACRRGGRIHINRPQKIIENLDDIPSPYKTGILPGALIKHIEYSRGCMYNCSYCVVAKDPYRHLSIQRIEEEILDCIENGSLLGLTAGSHLNHRNFGIQVLSLLKKYRDKGHAITLENILFIDGNNDDELFFNLLDEVTPDKEKLTLAVGIQCTHPTTLKRNRRVSNLENIRNIFEKWKFHSCAQLIIGLPGDNILRVSHTLAESVKLAPQRVQTLPMLIIPNTYLFENKEEFNIKADDMPPHTLHSICDQNKEKLRKTQIMANSCSLEYNCKRNF